MNPKLATTVRWYAQIQHALALAGETFRRLAYNSHRPGPSAFFWSRILNLEVHELCSTSRATRGMAQDELASLDQDLRFHAVQERQRQAWDAVNQAVLESSARFETAFSMELRALQQQAGHGDEGARISVQNQNTSVKCMKDQKIRPDSFSRKSKAYPNN